MNFTQAIESVFNQYTGFSGRARRSEYWYFFLLTWIVGIAIHLVVRLLHMSDTTQKVLTTVWELAVLLPSLAVSVRRLHDIGKSGWNILFGLIPIAGQIILLVFFLRDSQPGTNEYGTSEKYPHGIPFVRTAGGTQGSYYAPYSNHTPTSRTASYQPPQYHAPQQTPPGRTGAPDGFVNQEYDAPEDAGVVCPFCGARNVARSKFCTSCGASLNP